MKSRFSCIFMIRKASTGCTMHMHVVTSTWVQHPISSLSFFGRYRWAMPAPPAIPPATPQYRTKPSSSYQPRTTRQLSNTSGGRVVAVSSATDDAAHPVATDNALDSSLFSRTSAPICHSLYRTDCRRRRMGLAGSCDTRRCGLPRTPALVSPGATD